MNATACNLSPRPAPRARTRGSLLIVAMLLSAVIGISLVSYLKLCATTLNIASRSFLNNSAMNLAETGVEEALYCFNHNPTWSGWTITGSDATRTFSGFTPAPGASAVVKVYVQSYAGGSIHPKIVSKAIVTPNQGAVLTKYIEITLKKRSIFGFGLLARNQLNMNPTVTQVDSWNSDPDGDPSTPPVAYSTALRTSNVIIGTPSTVNGAINLGQSKIHGYVASGGGTIAYSTGAVVSSSFTATTVDTTRLSYDFGANFTTPTAPTPSATNTISSTITASVTLPRAGDVAASDGRYYYNFAATKIIDLQSSNQITVNGDVTIMLVNHSGTTSIRTQESASLTVNAGKSLQVYTNGNIMAGGTGGFLNNNTQSSNCLLYGTNTTAGGQSFELEGNNVIPPNFALYAPNSTFLVSSNAEFKGAVVAYNITFNADTNFHYDEALGSFGGNPYGLTKWKELQSSTERASYTTQFNSF